MDSSHFLRNSVKKLLIMYLMFVLLEAQLLSNNIVILDVSYSFTTQNLIWKPFLMSSNYIQQLNYYFSHLKLIKIPRKKNVIIPIVIQSNQFLDNKKSLSQKDEDSYKNSQDNPGVFPPISSPALLWYVILSSGSKDLSVWTDRLSKLAHSQKNNQLFFQKIIRMETKYRLLYTK